MRRAGLPVLVRGNVTYPKAGDLQQASKEVPAELVLVETDAPFLSASGAALQAQRAGLRVHTAHHVAGLRGTSYEELERTVEENSARVFGW